MSRGFVLIPVLIILAFLAVAFVKISPNSPFKSNASPSPDSSASASPSSSPTPTSKATTKSINKTPTPRPSPSTGGNLSPTPVPTNPAYYTSPTTAPAATSTYFPTAPSVRVTSPNGGESYTEGDNITISWDATGQFGSFVIMYCNTPNSCGSIDQPNGSARSLSWKVDVGNQTNTEFKIRIISYPYNWPNNPSDFSDNSFTVTQNPPLP